MVQCPPPIPTFSQEALKEDTLVGLGGVGGGGWKLYFGNCIPMRYISLKLLLWSSEMGFVV